jgi:FAD:protein FMN transferase
MTLLSGETVARWRVWSTTAGLVVTNPTILAGARELVEAELDAVDRACSRFRPDSELSLVEDSAEPAEVSPLLADLVGAALEAARRSGGDADPTLGAELETLGYDRDFATLPTDGPPVAVTVREAPGWRRVVLRDRMLSVPPGMRLDLGATAKAWTADRCARLVAEEFSVGVLVELGGDIATAGPAPSGGWLIRVRDRDGDPATVVRVSAGTALATSSTVSRSWRRGARLLHHVLDPRTCLPVPRIWRSVTVAADRCVDANTHSTAALVRGAGAIAALTAAGVPARLVDNAGRVHLVRGWPEEAA